MVKCAECGFLTYRNLETRTLAEAEMGFRQTGNVPQPNRPIQHGFTEVTFSSGGGFGSIPQCFARAANLREEAGLREDADEIQGIGDDFATPTLRVIAAERDCSEFTDWMQGFTPKEHREMMDRERLLRLEDERLKMDANFRSKEAEAARKWEAQESEKNRNFQKDMMASRTRKDIWVFGVIVTVMIVAATILGAFIERGFWWEERPVGKAEVTIQSIPDTGDSSTESTSE